MLFVNSVLSIVLKIECFLLIVIYSIIFIEGMMFIIFGEIILF